MKFLSYHLLSYIQQVQFFLKDTTDINNNLTPFQ